MLKSLSSLTFHKPLMLALGIFGSLNLIGSVVLAQDKGDNGTKGRLPPMDTPLNKELTALDKYVATPDPSYSYKVVRTTEDADGTLFVVDLKSQTWLTAEEVNRPVWQHWLLIYRPKQVANNKALMFIGGGANGKDPPAGLDRNIALVGRVIEGIEHMSSLPRGTGALGFYETQGERVPILSVRLGNDVKDVPAFEYLNTDSASFAAYADARANRRDPFFNVPAGGADICNIPVPIRRKAK